jgi:hypothetical protein
MTFDTDRSLQQQRRAGIVTAALRAGQPDGYLAQRRAEREVGWQPPHEEALDRFAAAGRVAWADVPDAEAWLRELRGGQP